MVVHVSLHAANAHRERLKSILYMLVVRSSTRLTLNFCVHTRKEDGCHNAPTVERRCAMTIVHYDALGTISAPPIK